MKTRDSLAIAGEGMADMSPADALMLDALQRDAFDYFAKWTRPHNGLVADTSRAGAPASIAVNSTATKVWLEDGQKIVELVNDGNTATTRVDQILTGIGRVPAVQGLDLEAAGVADDADAGVHVDDFLRTSNPRIFAVSDVCLAHQFTNTAKASARIVVRNALFLGCQRMSALTIPWCTHTDPEVAHVGMYVKEARQRRDSRQDGGRLCAHTADTGRLRAGAPMASALRRKNAMWGER